MTRRNRYYEDAHDERVEPHQGLDPHMPDPDWGNVLIHPDQKKMPVGDPTLWANTISTLIDDDPIVGNTARVIMGDQVVLAQAADRYSRSWSLSGVLQCPNDGWNQPIAGNLTPSSPYDSGAQSANPLAVWLSIVQGIEKITIEQQILLMAGGGVDNIGLCNNQFTRNGGPYGAVFSRLPPSEADQQGRSFAATGSLIGNTISIRAIYVRGGVPGDRGIIPSASISLLLTCYAPGAGI